MVRNVLRVGPSMIACGVLLSGAAATAGCANAHKAKTDCGSDVVYLDRNGAREGLLNCAGVAVGTQVEVRVGATVTVRMVKGTPPGITSSNSNVLATRGQVIRGVAVGVADVRIEASTLCGSGVVIACTLARVTVVP